MLYNNFFYSVYVFLQSILAKITVIIFVTLSTCVIMICIVVILSLQFTLIGSQ